MQMVLLLQNKHVVSSTYERGIYAVVIFSALKSEKERGFQGYRNMQKNYHLPYRPVHCGKEETAIWRGKQKNFHFLHVKVINMKFVMRIFAQIDKEFK